MSLEPRSKKPNDDTLADDEATLQLEPESEDDQTSSSDPWHAHATPRVDRAPIERYTPRLPDTADDTAMDHHEMEFDERTSGEASGATSGDALASAMNSQAGHMSDILRCALDSLHQPAMASADWLARDIDPDQPTAVALLTNPRITLAHVQQAKSVFKTMRIVGEKSADRRVGARMYAAAIAAGLVRHGRLVTRQSDEALKRGFQGLLDDQRMPGQLRDLAGMGLCALSERRYVREAKDSGTLPPSPGEAKPPRAKPSGKAAGRLGRNGR